jgi:DNA-binding transcriptional regulator YhcF (GntR family)
MRIANRIREYIIEEQRSGKLHPGDKLPGYKDLCRKFNTSYATVFNAVANFEKEGLVDRRNGIGLFLRGTEIMKVKLYICDDILTPELLASLQKMADERKLYLELEQQYDSELFESFPSDCHAVISTDMVRGGQVMDYSRFPDYHKELSSFPKYTWSSNIGLPFQAFVYQMSVNPKLLAKYGFKKKISGSDFSWIKSFSEFAVCHGKLQHDHWHTNYPSSASRYLYLFMGMLLNEKGSIDELFSGAFFNTKAGFRLIELLKCFSYDTNYENFKDCACNFYSGSWLPVQYKHKFDLKDDELKIIPYMHNGRIMYYFRQTTLSTYTREYLSDGEKHRLWELVKLILSRQFQLEMTDRLGIISVRRDIGPRDYSWNTRPDFNYFIPQPGGLVIKGNIIKDYIIFVFSTLIEQAVFFGADPGQILELCDRKLEFKNNFDAKITEI